MKIYMTPRAFWHLQWMAQRTDCDPPYGGLFDGHLVH